MCKSRQPQFFPNVVAVQHLTFNRRLYVPSVLHVENKHIRYLGHSRTTIDRPSIVQAAGRGL